MGRQNLYAKCRDGLQRILDVQRMIHPWTRPHWGLGKKTTPAMAMGYCNRSISTLELFTVRGFHCVTYKETSAGLKVAESSCLLLYRFLPHSQ
jgi:hypothetical protein